MKLMTNSPIVSSLSGNSRVSFTVSAMGFRDALGVSTKGLFHPRGLDPIF